jgi:hypothetical protein
MTSTNPGDSMIAGLLACAQRIAARERLLRRPSRPEARGTGRAAPRRRRRAARARAPSRAAPARSESARARDLRSPRARPPRSARPRRCRSRTRRAPPLRGHELLSGSRPAAPAARRPDPSAIEPVEPIGAAAVGSGCWPRARSAPPVCFAGSWPGADISPPVVCALGVGDQGLGGHTGLRRPARKPSQTGVFGLVEHAALGAGVREQQARDGVAVRLVEQLITSCQPREASICRTASRSEGRNLSRGAGSARSTAAGQRPA